MRLSIKCLILAAYIILLLPLPHAVVLKASIDPSPLFELLKDSLDAVAVGDYESANKLLSIALDVELPSDIAYIHRTTYLRLRNVVELMKTSKSLGNYVNTTYLRSIIYDLNRAHYDLNSSINSYISSLPKHFTDVKLRDYYLSRVSGSLINFHKAVNEVISDAVLRYLGTASGVVEVSAEAPNTIYGNSEYVLRLHVSTPDFVDFVNALIYVNYGGIYSYLNTSIITNEYVELVLKAPPAEHFVRSGFRLSSELSYEVLVRVFADVDGAAYLGQTSFKGVLRFLQPDLKVTPYLNGSRLESLIIDASIPHTLNASIYVDDKLITTAELLRGANEVALGIDLLPGKHVLRVVTEPKARYMGLSLRYDLIVGQVTPKASVTPQHIPLGPPFNTLLNVFVDTAPYRLKLVVGGNTIYDELVNSTATSLAITLPWTTLIWGDVRYFVEPSDPTYSSSNGVVRIYVVNVPLLTSLSTATSLILLSRNIRRRIKRLLTPPRYVPLVNVLRGDAAVTAVSGISFRKPKLYRLYRRFVAIVSKLVEPPKHHETLREFLLRIKNSLTEDLYGLISHFIHGYELDLYSNHSVDVGSMREVLRRIGKVVKKL
ncbi:MAG: hypothetical protein NZ911_03040 [Sulfolobales archaeon]|nr:hypothetical protein [Sulfolobales archaeon]